MKKLLRGRTYQAATAVLVVLLVGSLVFGLSKSNVVTALKADKAKLHEHVTALKADRVELQENVDELEVEKLAIDNRLGQCGVTLNTAYIILLWEKAHITQLLGNDPGERGASLLRGYGDNPKDLFRTFYSTYKYCHPAEFS